MDNLLVTAWLRGSHVVLDPRMGVMLDGILASVVRDQQKSVSGLLSGSDLDGGLDVKVPAKVELPLMECETNQGWHWVCSVSRPVDETGEPLWLNLETEVHYAISRLKEKVTETVSQRLPMNLHPSQGRYKMRRVPVVTALCAGLQWACVGNKNVVSDLLEDVFSVGGERGRGEGLVNRWVVDVVDNAPNGWGHVWEAGQPARPLPLWCPSVGSIEETFRVGVRPPYWHRGNQEEVSASGSLADSSFVDS